MEDERLHPIVPKGRLLRTGTEKSLTCASCIRVPQGRAYATRGPGTACCTKLCGPRPLSPTATRAAAEASVVVRRCQRKSYCSPVARFFFFLCAPLLDANYFFFHSWCSTVHSKHEPLINEYKHRIAFVSFLLVRRWWAKRLHVVCARTALSVHDRYPATKTDDTHTGRLLLSSPLGQSCRIGNASEPCLLVAFEETFVDPWKRTYRAATPYAQIRTPEFLRARLLGAAGWR